MYYLVFVILCIFSCTLMSFNYVYSCLCALTSFELVMYNYYKNNDKNINSILKSILAIKLFCTIFYANIAFLYVINNSFSLDVIWNSFIFVIITSIVFLNTISRYNESSEDNLFGIPYLLGSFFYILDVVTVYRALNKLNEEV